MQETLIRSLVVIAAAGAVFALALRLVAGARWFSFYGVATVVLAALPFLTATLSRHSRANGRARWPVWIAAVLTAVPALIQIGFWFTFFAQGADGAALAIGRAAVLEKVGGLLPFLWLALAACWVWLLARALPRRA